MKRSELVARWRQRRDSYARVGVLVEGAKLVDELLGDLDGLTRTEEDRLLTLGAASRDSGYSVGHLARLIREGRIPNAGRRCAPRIRAGDLPSRGEFARKRLRSYDVDTDARTLRNERQ